MTGSVFCAGVTEMTSQEVTSFSPALFSYYSTTKCSTVVQVLGVPEVIEGHVTPNGAPFSQVCVCATRSFPISALVEHFHRKWRHQPWMGGVCACATWSCIIFRSEVSLGCCLGRPRPTSSMATGTSPLTGYLPLLFSYNIIYFNNGFHLRCFRICCVVLQVVYHVRVAFLLYFQRSWRFLIPSSNFCVY